jgi:hypothetical protein
VLRKGKQLLLHLCYPLCYYCNKSVRGHKCYVLMRVICITKSSEAKYIVSNFVLNFFTDTETIIATNRELKKSIMCIRCHTNEKCMLFVNCGHRVTCESCSNQIDYCPYCDVKIKIKLKTFLS